MDKVWIVLLILFLVIFVIYTLAYIFRLRDVIKGQDFLLQSMAKEITYLRSYIYDKERVQESEEVWDNIF